MKESERKALIESKAGLLVSCKLPFADIVRELTELYTELAALEQEQKIIKALSGEEIEDIPTFTSTDYKQPEGAEGIKNNIAIKYKFDNWDDLIFNALNDFKNDCINEAMQEYAQQSKREELPSILKEFERFQERMIRENKGYSYYTFIDEYLKS